MKRLLMCSVLVFSITSCSLPKNKIVAPISNEIKVQHFNFDKMETETISEGIERKWFHGQKGQMAYFYMDKSAHIPWHSHPNEQITYILEGKVKVKTIIDGEETFVIVSAGEVIIFPENVPHEFWALEKTVDLDIHVPVRQDWLSTELPDYLKKSK